MMTIVTIEQAQPLDVWMDSLLGEHKFTNGKALRNNNRTVKVRQPVLVTFGPETIEIQRGSEVTFFRHPKEAGTRTVLSIRTPGGDVTTVYGDHRVTGRAVRSLYNGIERRLLRR